MKATLTFNLPEDQFDFKLAVDGYKWYTVAYDLDQHIRGILKYSSEPIPDDTYEALEKVREKIRELMEENCIQFD